MPRHRDFVELNQGDRVRVSQNIQSAFEQRMRMEPQFEGPGPVSWHNVPDPVDDSETEH